MNAPRPPGRPPKDKPVLQRHDLLVAAAAAFARGYGSASVRGLAAHLGVSQSAVQHHARTKEDLLFAVIDELLVPQLAAVPGQTRSVGASGPGDDAASPLADLRTLVRRRVTAIAEHGGLVLAVLDDTSPGADRRRAYLAERLTPLRRAGLDALAGLADRGVTRRFSDGMWTALITVGIPAIVRSWPRVQELDGEPTSLEAALDELADLIVHGLARETP